MISNLIQAYNVGTITETELVGQIILSKTSPEEIVPQVNENILAAIKEKTVNFSVCIANIGSGLSDKDQTTIKQNFADGSALWRSYFQKETE